ncbi:DUF226 domain-containing protein [Borreliella bavariensis]|uniref:DUF226 domain-containing protein n=1 Tax=Borreliella bavariensis TaxID=664662 RepID=UPI002D7E3DE2|nr:DUF226 domain-containing protein [Borreliella bavariensis]
MKKPIERGIPINRKQIPLKNHTFFKKEIVGDRTIYHTRLNNILRGFDVKLEKVFVFFTNLFTKEKKYVTLFPTREGDEFLGMFYGFKKIRNNPFYSDYTSVCNFSKKKFKTYNKSYFVEFRFKKGSVFCYLHTIAYLLVERQLASNRKLYKQILNLEKAVFAFYSKDLIPGGVITKWIQKTKEKKLDLMDRIENLINPPRGHFTRERRRW